MLICTGDRDALQLVSDQVTVLYPRKGVSDLCAHDPGGDGGEVRADAGAVPRLRGAARRPERQPAQHPARGGEDRDQVGRGVRRPRRAGRAGRRGQGQGRRRAARPPRPGDPEPPAHRAGPRRPDRGDARRPGAGQLGARRGRTRSSTPWSSGSCATGSTRRSRPPSRRPTRASTSPRGCWRAGELAGWLAEHASGAGRLGVHISGYWGGGTGDVVGVALAARPTARARGSSPTDLDADRREGLRRRGWPTRRGPRRCTTPRGRCWPSPRAAGSWPGSPATPRCRRTSRCPTSAATTSPTSSLRYLRRELRAEDDGGGQLSFDGAGRGGGGARPTSSVRARSSTSPTGWTPSSRRRPATRLLREVELPLVEVLAEMERTGIAVDPTTWRRSRRSSAAR